MMEGQKILIALALISVFGCAISIRISDLALYNFLNNRPANGRERNLVNLHIFCLVFIVEPQIILYCSNCLIVIHSIRYGFERFVKVL